MLFSRQDRASFSLNANVDQTRVAAGETVRLIIPGNYGRIWTLQTT